MSAGEQWQHALAAWAIPAPIVAAAPESPWGFPAALFARRADALPAQPTPSTQRALDALPAGGTVLDVGCGAGAGSLPLAGTADHLIGVDSSIALLAAFRERGEARGCTVTTVEGIWPAVADHVPVADVAICHHVVYNVPDLAPFVRRLTDHARHRVVLELPVAHPMSTLNPLWLQFHGVVRPTRPTIDDALAVLRATGLTPSHTQWEAPAMGWSGTFARQDDLVAWVRRLLCLPANRDGELAAALEPRLVERDGAWSLPPQPVVTVWWDTPVA